MNLPEIKSLCLISENILLLTIQEKEVRGGVQIPYIEEPGEILEQDSGIPALVYIVRDGKRIGVRVEDPQFGPKRFPYESLIGESLDLSAADAPNSYLVNGLCPGRVFRKTKPNNMADPYLGYSFLHRIYLIFAKPFSPAVPWRFVSVRGFSAVMGLQNILIPAP